MKPSLKLGQGKRSYDRAFSDHTRLVPDISNNWPSSLSTSSSDQYTFSPSSPSGDSDDSQPDHWDITLDRDLYETIIKLYPDWFKENMAEEIAPDQMLASSPGSPRSVVDEASIQKSMERNKESLKVKLLLRRPISQLVEQGILPPLKASPVFYEQSKKLERARMEDFLKQKIQRRPDRQALIEQHILEDTTISPGLQDKQRQLKKARLADDLNDRLSHRPGPLELIKGNILLADERVAQAIKEGAIHFKATCEGEPVKHPPPLFHLEDPETSSDGTRSPQDISPPICGPVFPALVPSNEVGITSIPIIQPPPPVAPTPTTIVPSSSTFQIAPLQLSSIFPVTSSSTAPQSNVITFTSFNATSTTPSIVANQIQSVPQFKPIFTTGTTTGSTSSNKSESSKQRKKSKSKVQPKTRTIKFHEYKGPPNAQKNSESSSASQPESSYELMLKQQQLLLQLELEWQQKMASGIILTSTQNQESTDKLHSQTIVIPHPTQPSIQVTSSNVPNAVVTLETPLQKTIANVPPAIPVQAVVQSSSGNKLVCKLEDLKVNDLKIQLKKRSLTVSGSKPQLIERLKPFADEVIASVRASMADANKCKDDPSSPSSNSASPMSDQQKMSVPVSPADAPMDTDDKSRKTSSVPMDVNDNYVEIQQNHHHPSFVSTFGLSEMPPITATPFNNGYIINEDILKLQQKRIEQLQRELENSQQQQLQQQQQFHFQLQHPFSFHPQAQTISIPLASISTPQFQVISTPAPNNMVTLRAEPTQPPHQPPPPKPAPVTTRKSSDNPAKSQNQRRHSHATTINKETAQAPRKTSASVKASLAAFLHNQQANAAAQQANCAGANSRSEPQTPESGSSVVSFGSSSKQSRANSLTINASSVPSSNSTSHPVSLPSGAYQRPPPPNYEEATRDSSGKAVKEMMPRKKSVKSQAVDDVLEILIKNGELPESAAQEPPTPVEKFGKSVFDSSSSSKDFIPTAPLVQRVAQVEEQAVVKAESSGDMNLDLDFALDLQELADSMDLSDMTHTPDKNSSFWMPDLGFNPNESAKKNNSSINEVSLNDLMEAANSVDWLSDLMSNNNNHVTSNNQLNSCRSDHRSREVPSDTYYNPRTHCDRTLGHIPNGYNFSHHGKAMVNDQSHSSSGSSSCSSSYAAKDHDPVLPNNMLGTTSTTDPLIDLFFDETDFKPSSHDLSVWDRLDFST